jgi:hypothetical protein
MKRGIVIFLRFAVAVIGLAVLLLCVFWVPALAERAANVYLEFQSLKYPVVLAVFLTTIPFYLAVYQTMKLLHLIEHKNAFSEMAVAALKNIKQLAMAEVVLYVLGLAALALRKALHPGIALMVGAIVFAALTISLFAALLQELLSNALEIKAENDLTV